MVKNLPAVERSTKIRFGKNVPEATDQAENTIVFNASNVSFDVSNPGAVYLSPIRLREDYDDPQIVLLMYNKETKEITESGEAATDIIQPSLESATRFGNVITVNTVEFNNAFTSFVTASNVGIVNTFAAHTLSVGSNLYIDDTGSNVLVVSGNVAVLRDMVIDGNLRVNGDTTVIYTENTSIKDAFIELGRDNTSGDTTLDLGVLMHRPDALSNVVVGYREGTDEFAIAYTEAKPTDKTFVPKTDEDINVHVYGRVLTEANVGIINTSPIHTLDVGSNLYVDEFGSNILVVQGNTNVTGDLTVDTDTLYVNSVASKVGIKTTSPDAELHVVGNVYASSNLTVDEDTLHVDALTHSVGVETKNPDANLHVVGNVYVSSNLTVDEDTFHVDALTHSVGIETKEPDANLHVVGNVYVTSNLTVDTDTLHVDALTHSVGIETKGPDANLHVVGNVYVTSNLTVDTDTLHVDTVADRVGINTKEPDANLHVVGNAYVSNTLTLNDPTTALVTDLTSNVLVKLNQLSNVEIDTTSATESLRSDHILVYDGSNWINDYPKHTYVKVFNDSGVELKTGNVVYVVGTHNANLLEVALAKADDPATMPAFGVVTSNILQSGEGVAVTYGKAQVSGIQDFVEGETVYVSNVHAGMLSNIKPFYTDDVPNLIQNVGIVTKSGGGAGSIFVTGVGRANDVPNAQIVEDEGDINWVYVNNVNNDFKKIVPSNLLTQLQTLEQVSAAGNNVSNIISFSNVTTGIVTTGNVQVGSNISVIGLADPSNKYLPMVDTTGTFIKSPVYVTDGGKYVISASEAEFLGNITLGGNTTIISSTSVTIEDRIFGVGANNSVTGLDSGFMIEHQHEAGDYANIALIHHAVDHRFAIGYTQNTFTDDHILYYQYPGRNLLIDLQGNLLVQNNITVSEFGTYYGNAHGLSNITLQQVTQYGNVTANTIEFTNALSFVASGNVGIANTAPEHTIGIGSNVYVDDVGSNVIHAIGNVYATRFIGDGYFLSNIASNLEQIVTNGNVTTQTISIENDTLGLITTGPVGVANIAPDHTLSIGSNVYVDDTGSNVIHAIGNVYATRFIGDGYFLSNIASNLEQIVTNGNVTTQTISIENDTLGLITTGPVGVANIAPDHTLSIGSNVYVDDTGSNVIHAIGNVYATRFIGDGYFLSNIASNLEQIVTNGNVTTQTISIENDTLGLITTGPVGVANIAPDHTLSIGSNVYVDDTGSNVIHAIGNVYATRFIGDGYFLSNIATNLAQIVTNGNVTTQTISIENDTLGLITTGPVGVANIAPDHTLSIGSNVYVDDTGSNVIHAIGNVYATRFIGDGYFLSNIASNLEQIVTNGNVTTQTISIENDTLGLITTGPVGVANIAPDHTLSIGSNVYVDDTGSNVIHAIGNVYATRFIGDGYFLSNIATNLAQIVTNGNVTTQTISIENDTLGLITTGPVGVANIAPDHTLSIGSNVYVDDTGSNVIHAIGNVYATRFIGDGYFLSNIASNLEQIVTNGNVTTQTISIENDTLSLITTGPAGIANTSPDHTLSFGSNVYIDDVGSNALVISGNILASKITLGDVSITPTYTFQQISTTGNTTSRTIEFNNADTSLVTTSNVGIATSAPAYTLEVNGTAAKTGGGTWTSTSDARLKENIQDANLDTCYDTIKNLKLRRFTWRDDVEGITDKNVIGWIAQEVEEVLPKSVTTVHEKYGLENVKFLNADQIYAAMFGTIQKLIDDKERLEAQVAELMKK